MKTVQVNSVFQLGLFSLIPIAFYIFVTKHRSYFIVLLLSRYGRKDSFIMRIVILNYIRTFIRPFEEIYLIKFVKESC